MAVHIHSDGDLAALNVLLLMPKDGTAPSDRINTYSSVIASHGLPPTADFPKNLNAVGQLINQAAAQWSAVQNAVDALIRAINTSAGAYSAAQGGSPAVNLIGWGAAGFNIVNQVAYLADILIDQIPAEANKYQELGALNLVILRNSTDGNASFRDFASQLGHYFPQAHALTALDPFRVAMEGINAAFAANATPFNTAQQNIATLLTTFQTFSQQGALDWTSCGFTSLSQIDSLARKGLQ
jgi:hypothetical protein